MNKKFVYQVGDNKKVMITYVHQFCVLARHCNGCYLSVQAKEIRSLNLMPNPVTESLPSIL